MKRFSLVKLFTALTIMSVYIFTFGVSGAVEEETVKEDNIVFESQVESGAVPEYEDFGLPTLEQNYVPFEFDLSDAAKQYLKDPETNTGDNQTQSVPYFSSSQGSASGFSSSSGASSSKGSSLSSSDSSSSSSLSGSSQSVPSISSSSVGSSSVGSSSSSAPATSSEIPTLSSSSYTSSEESPSTPGSPADEEVWVNCNGEIVRGTALDIVSRIVMIEMGPAFSPEAIKAQAVAAYTNVIRANKAGSAENVVMKNTITAKVKNIVAEVLGQAVYYDGKLIQAAYSASSAGYTASSKNVWGVDYPYLQSIYCELDEKFDPNYGKTQTFTSEAVKTKIKDKTGIELSGDPSQWFEIVDYTEGKYVGNMKIGGQSTYVNSSGKTVKITGRALRETIFDFAIRSHAFEISYDSANDAFTFTTYGYGHGVGLSQNGADALAIQYGWNYKQILEFYYQGAEVK